jgi:hypothetical protein
MAGAQPDESRTNLARLVCAIPFFLLLGISASANDVPLLDFTPSFDTKTIKVNAGAKLSAIHEPFKIILHVDADHAHAFPGIEFPCPTGHWDLSNFAYVAVDLRNPADRAVRVEMRVDNPGADGLFNCCADGVDLPPRSAATLRVPLRRRKPDWVKVELPGMNGHPWGMPQGWGKPGQGTIDPANVTNLIVFTAHPREDCAYEILDIRAGGAFTPPTELLKDPAKFLPFIDTFGQYIHRDWPGKTHGLADLARAREEEAKDLAAHPGPPQWDQYGGWKTVPALDATGFFRAAKHNGKWWLVDPDGRLFFSQGIDAVTPFEGDTPIGGREKWFADLPPVESRFKDCYHQAWIIAVGDYKGQRPACFDFGRANLMRKYGNEWPTAFADVTHRRMRSWGINTLGNWDSPEIYLRHQTPYTASISVHSKFLEGSNGYWGKFCDVFDPSFITDIRQTMRWQKRSTAGDPWCIGYFVDNEQSWGEDGISLALASLTSPPTQAAKLAFIEDLKHKYLVIESLNLQWGTSHASWDALVNSTTPPDAARARADLDAFYLRFARKYFETVRDAVKEAAPHHLYLGCRFASSNPSAAAAAAEFCDVVSFNVYQRTPNAIPFPMTADVPIIIGEFHFGALDRGLFHTGLIPVENQAERAAAYKTYVQAALRDPRMVGCHWFKYVDEPTTGRTFDGENYQIGFVDIVDTPYPEIVGAARELGASMYDLRMK